MRDMTPITKGRIVRPLSLSGGKTMSVKKSNGNVFDGLVAIQLCTKSWSGIVNLTKEDLGLEQVPVCMVIEKRTS
jgi:hypothetical protein